jgi:hypothetical protein
MLVLHRDDRLRREILQQRNLLVGSWSAAAFWSAPRREVPAFRWWRATSGRSQQGFLSAGPRGWPVTRFLGGVSGPRETGVTAAIWVALLRHPEPQRHEASHRNREIERPYNRL